MPRVKTMKETNNFAGTVQKADAQVEEWIAEDRRLTTDWLRSPRRESGRSDSRSADGTQGRQQKRSALAVPLWLTSLDQPGELDWTVTENVSDHGARILTNRRWHVNEALLVSLPPRFSANGRVVYCNALPSGNYVLGIEIRESFAAWVGNLEGAA
jgi:PilZ domain